MVPENNFPGVTFEEDIIESLKVLRQGGIILYPTDTIWGLGCDPTNESAVNKIFKVKSRDESKSLIILVDSLSMIERYVKDCPEIAFELAEVSDTPLTIIYPEGKNLAPGVCGNDNSIGIRICTDEFCSHLIERFRKPIISTSANFSGSPSPGNFSLIEKTLIDKVDYVVSWNQNDKGRSVPSPVIKINYDGTIKIIRK
jgi:L-threonylcarbamoyladenylate synthase